MQLRRKFCLLIAPLALTLAACSGGGGGASSASSSAKPGTMVPAASGAAASASSLSANFGTLAAAFPIYSTTLPSDIDGAAPILSVVRGFFRGAATFDMYSCMANVLGESDLATVLFDGSTHILEGADPSYKYRVSVTKTGGVVTSFTLDSAIASSPDSALTYSLVAGNATATFSQGGQWFRLQGPVSNNAWSGTKTMNSIGTDPNASNAAVEMTIVQAGSALSVAGTHGSFGNFYSRVALDGTTLWNLKMGHGAAKSDYTITNSYGLAGVVGWSDIGADAVASTSSHYTNVDNYTLAAVDHNSTLTPSWAGNGTVDFNLSSRADLATKILDCETAYTF